MDRIDQTVSRVLNSAQSAPTSARPQTREQRLQVECDNYNSFPGDLNDGIECERCLNRGYIAVIHKGYRALQECDCMKSRKSKSLMHKSGLGKLLEECTFDFFEVRHMWQQTLKAIAMEYADEHYKDSWFFVGGPSGAGKSHICTAIVSYLIKRNVEVRFYLWRDMVIRLKQKLMDNDYFTIMQELKECPVLYIDDFLKSDGKPTSADLNIAYEILNHRYNKELPTIISTEYQLNEILAMDEAVGGRIYELAGKYTVNIARDPSKNFRLQPQKVKS